MDNMLKLECAFCKKTSCILWFPQETVYCPYCGRSKRSENYPTIQERIDAVYKGSDFDVHNGKLVRYTGTSLSPVIPPGIFGIGDDAFRNTKITGVTIPNTVGKIGCGAFQGTPLERLEIPESVGMIGRKAFMNCSQLTQISLSSKLEFIDSYAFSGCGLVSLSVPWSVKKIGFGVFRDCEQLTDVHFQGRKPKMMVGTTYDTKSQRQMPILKIKIDNLHSLTENPKDGYISGLFYNTPWEKAVLQKLSS